MRMRIIRLLLAVSFLLSLVPSSIAVQNVKAQVTSFAVSGYVKDGKGVGLPGIRVYAEPKWKLFLPILMSSNTNASVEPSPVSPYLSVLTDSDGYYAFDSIPSGDYILRVDLPGVDFVPASRLINASTTESQDFDVLITPAVISENTLVLTNDSNQFLVASPDLTTFTFSQTSTELDALKVGDVIVSEPCPAAPNGYLRKVLTVTPGGTGVILSTEAATLEEAITDGSLFRMETLDPSKVTSTLALPGVEMTNQIEASTLTFYFNLPDVVLYDADGSSLTEGDQIKANGSIEFEMEFILYLNMQSFQVRRFSMTNKNTLRDTLEIFTEIELGSLEEEVLIATQSFTPITLFVGLVPVVFVPKLDLIVGVDGSVKVGISTSVTHEVSMKAGIQYQYPSGWSPIAEVTNTFTYKPPHLTMEMSLKAYFGARFNLYLYGLAGPFVKITPYLEIVVQPLEDPWWTLFAGLDVPVGFRAIDQLAEVLKLEEYEAVSIGVKLVLAQSSVPPAGEMVFVEAGNFQMGCSLGFNAGFDCYDNELPLHEVWLDDYYIDKTEVTNAYYRQCVDAGACEAPEEYSSSYRESYYDDPAYANYPVVWVNWYKASNYCTWVGKRLPTEAEWEKAARGTTPHAFPWGDSQPTCDLVNARAKWNPIGALYMMCDGDTTVVDGHPDGVSPYGVLDMSGNVVEFVSDWYSSGYYWESPDVNPTGPVTGSARVLRGGYSDSFARDLRTAQRGSAPPSLAYHYIGFRCASTTLP